MADLSNFYCQRNQRYLYSPLGKGIGGSTIYNYGCYFVSLCRQLKVDPIQFNYLLIKYDLWDNQNYIKVSELSTKLPTLFKNYKSQDSFTMDQFEAWCNDKNIIAVCKVSAIPIGGSGTHFVGEERRDSANAVIFDPWYGDIIKVADRYGNHQNILSMRIFYLQDNWEEALNKLLGNSQSSTINNQESKNMTYEQFYNKFLEAFRKHKDTIEWGNDKHNFESKGLIDEAMIGRMIDNIARDKANKAKELSDCQNKPPQTIEKIVYVDNSKGIAEEITINGKKWQLNGVTKDSNGLLVGNYKRI